ncbi:phospholipid carrier-dependent glycosyltransferase [Aquisphaera insulae]|uniref:phospholipid carrier-dependent glycosyltransferase n=1 Tax=Aquisphaera insulae TaxID=2712864 RepID=UPI0013EB2E10|nr:phospholipid carrier-dependent glycosyltransferase [Aquisphaera insulae]
MSLPALAVLFIAGIWNPAGSGLHPDEAAWVNSSYYFELLARGERSHPDWRLLPARESPFVGKFLFGLALRMAGRPVRSFEPLAAWHEVWHLPTGTTAWGSGLARAEREAVSRRLSPEARQAVREGRYPFLQAGQLGPPRRVVLGFGMLCAAVVAAIGTRCRGPMTGLAAGLILAAHRLAIEAYTHALFDMIALAFSALAVLGLIALVGPMRGEPSGLRRMLFVSLITGLMLALAVGTKMNALIVVMVAAELGLIAACRGIWGREHPARGGALCLGLSLAVGVLVFVAINPTLHGHPWSGLVDLFAMPARTEEVQASFLPDHLIAPSQKAHAIGTILCGHPAGLLVLGLAMLWPTWNGLRRFSPRTVLVLWWWTALGAVLAWIPFPWPRYVLPVLPPAALLTADLVASLAGNLTNSLSRPDRGAEIKNQA